jgi:hypothetical protein
MNKKETAVEWLQETLSIHFTFEQKMQFEGLFQQAKGMEKEQMIDFATIAYQDISNLMNVPFNQISENKINFETVFNQIYN